MHRRPTEVSPDLQAAVEGGKRITFHYSPNTKVILVSTDAAEAQQILEACQPVEEEVAVEHVLQETQWAMLHAFNEDPEATKALLRTLLTEMEQA